MFYRWQGSALFQCPRYEVGNGNVDDGVWVIGDGQQKVNERAR